MIGASKKLLQATAGNAGGGPLDVDEVFSTYLYEGNGSTQTITNDIDLAGEGGLVWVKWRDGAGDHNLVDSERGKKVLFSNSTGSEANFLDYTVKSFNSNGFSVDSHPTESASINWSGNDYASWTFRKAPKFFDVVTWTGTANQTITHSLGVEPGMIIVKRTGASEDWWVYHRSATNDLKLNSTAAQLSFSVISSVSSTSFNVNLNTTSGSDGYVAYLFAHNNNDGEFGPDGDQDIIKCGSYTADSSNAYAVDVGFEPQWVMIKRTDSTGDWEMLDTMRGFTADPSGGQFLEANKAGAEFSDYGAYLTSTGFVGSNQSASSGGSYIYIAIRRGPLAPPESATDVFAVVGGGFPATSGFPVDSVLSTYFETYANNHMLYDRLRATDGSRLLFTHSNAAENTSNPFSLSIASNTGVERSWGSGWNHKMFRRAPGFFDVVAYTGAGSNQTLKHNLTVKPELSIVKYRTGAYSISAYASWGTNTLTDGTNNPTLFLDTDRNTIGSTNAYWQEATNTEIYVGGANNENSFTYIMYLFATLAGISKVGKYTGNGSSQTINCGFTSGARYVLIKRYDSAGDWYVWDTARGIVAGNDPYMRLNVTTGEVTSNDSIDPASSGFIVNQVSATNINVSGAKYAYYSVA